MNLKENINFKNGNITYYDFNIDPRLPIKDQINYMQDGLIQIEYKNYIVDVGWRPECNINGSFILLVIKDHEWQTPIHTKETRSLSRLNQYLQECIDLATNLAGAHNTLHNGSSQHYITNIHGANTAFDFDRLDFKNFFDEEAIADMESGAFHYSIKLGHGFELEVNILAIDKFISLRLQNESLQSPIFDIGFDEIVKIKLNKREDLDYVGLDLYKDNQKPSSDGNNPKPFLSITIKPNVSITLGV